MSRRARARGTCPVCGKEYALRWVNPGDGGGWVLRKHGKCDGWGYDPVEVTYWR